MKKYYILVITVLLTLSAKAQAPEQMSYQAVIRDASNALVTSQAIGMQISILKGSATGISVYTETQTANTNTSGLVSLEIGTGTTGDDFSAINWADDTYFIKTEMDPTGGSSYTITGTSQLLSVPYALYAKNSGDKVFSTTNNVTSNANGDIANDDFVFGATQLDGTETRMLFDKSKAAFRVGKVNSTEWDEGNIGHYSLATGFTTTASGVGSTAMGTGTEAVGNYSTAMGYSTTASGESSTTMGENTIASGDYSIAMGSATIASENYSTAMGINTIASGSASTTMGSYTVASGNRSTAMGNGTTAETYIQTTLGTNNTTVTGDFFSFVPTDRLFVVGNGVDTNNKSDALIILKNGIITAPSLDIAEIIDNKALVTKEYVDANGATPATGLEKITEGGNTGWRLIGQNPGNYGDIGENAVDLSYNNDASTTRGATGDYSIAIGYQPTASGISSIAIGQNAKASGENATAIGYFTVASGGQSTAMGAGTEALGDQSIAMGSSTEASGYISTAMGAETNASGYYSTAMGRNTTAETSSQTSIGTFNTFVIGNVTNFKGTDRLFVIGNGTSSSAKSDAMVVLKNGNTTINGNLAVDEVNATDSGTADMKAYIYGLVRNTGAIDVASSDGFTITKTGTGAYAVNFNNSPGGYNKYIVVASLYGSDGIGFIKMERQSSSITVNTYNTSGTLTDKYFSFIVYKK